MNRKKWFLAAGFPAIIILTVVAAVLASRSYTLYVNNPFGSDNTAVSYSAPGLIENTEIKHLGVYSKFVFRPVKTGECVVTITIYNQENTNELTMVRLPIKVLKTGTMYISGYDYGGYGFTLLGMTVFMLYAFSVCLLLFRKNKRKQFFSYKTMLSFALSLFFGLQSLLYLGLVCAVIVRPDIFDAWRVFNYAGFIMMILFAISLPAIVLFSLFMSLSNLSLIRHEGFGKNNLVGILISLVLFAGSVMCVFTAYLNPNSTDTELTSVRDAMLRVAISTAFVYFECILCSAVFCTQFAARHEPERNKDFIIILGCRVGDDGKPLPLLRGRIDRAIAFYRRQLDETGKEARFIPSGGKGGDEVISEAACIKNYLIEQGIDERLIFPETRSTTTLENMRFSKEIADRCKPEANILFSTTNYHVFRSGMFAAGAGMRAEGVGAKTKWYFWPNAQMREFIGLLASEWKVNLLFIVAIVAVSLFFSNISTLVQWAVG